MYRTVFVPRRKTKQKLDLGRVKNWIIASLIVIVVMMLGVILNLKRANNLRDYAIANNCTWTWQGTLTGTDADYICKKN